MSKQVIKVSLIFCMILAPIASYLLNDFQFNWVAILKTEGAIIGGFCWGFFARKYHDQHLQKNNNK